jgi:hypothetical protein
MSRSTTPGFARREADCNSCVTGLHLCKYLKEVVKGGYKKDKVFLN